MSFTVIVDAVFDHRPYMLERTKIFSILCRGRSFPVQHAFMRNFGMVVILVDHADPEFINMILLKGECAQASPHHVCTVEQGKFKRLIMRSLIFF